CTSPALLVIGILTFAAPLLYVPRYTMTSASATALWAISASTVPSQLPVVGEASSRLTTSILKPPTAPPWCFTARSTACFIAVPSGIMAPCIGQLVTILVVPCAWTAAMPMPVTIINTRLTLSVFVTSFILAPPLGSCLGPRHIHRLATQQRALV